MSCAELSKGVMRTGTITSDGTSSLGSTASGRPQHSRRFNSHASVKVSRVMSAVHASLIGMSTAATKTMCLQADRLIRDPVTSKVNTAHAEPQMMMPAFALANAVVDVSLGSSATSSISGSASQHIQQEAHAKPASAASETKPGDHTAANTQPCNATSAVLSHVPIVQLLSQLDSVKWGQVAAWAAGDSAQAAALVEHLGPSIAESGAASEADQDHALLRLEAQVMRKKLVRLIVTFSI